MTLPQTMTIIAAEGAGGPEVLKPATAPLPAVRADEVLIRVRAAAATSLYPYLSPARAIRSCPSNQLEA